MSLSEEKPQDQSCTHTDEIRAGEAGTADVHDPLNWSTLQKLVLLNALGFWIFLGTANALINGSALSTISAEFSVPIADTTYLIGAVALMYGVGSIVWVAFGNRYGVRLTFVLTATAAGCMAFWGARATSFGSLMAARILSSLFYSSPETLGPQVAGDVFFLKDRAKVVTFIVVWQGSGFALGPLIGAYIFE
jgi:MFS family permease